LAFYMGSKFDHLIKFESDIEDSYADIGMGEVEKGKSIFSLNFQMKKLLSDKSYEQAENNILETLSLYLNSDDDYMSSGQRTYAGVELALHCTKLPNCNSLNIVKQVVALQEYTNIEKESSFLYLTEQTRISTIYLINKQYNKVIDLLLPTTTTMKLKDFPRAYWRGLVLLHLGLAYEGLGMTIQSDPLKAEAISILKEQFKFNQTEINDLIKRITTKS